MKLCIVASGNFDSTYGGGQVYVKNLVDELIRQQEHLELVLSILSFDTEFSYMGEQKIYKGVPVYEIHPRGDMKSLLIKIHPDVVHAHGEKATVASLCKELNIRCIITAHHGGILCPAGSLLNSKDQICHVKAAFEQCLPCYLRNIRTGSYWYPLLKHLSMSHYLQIGKDLKRLPFLPLITPLGQAAISIQEKFEDWNIIKNNADLLIAPSVAIAESLKLNGADASKIKVISHGIPLPKETIPFPDTTQGIKFYYVGRICYVKGIHILLKAFSRISAGNVELHLIGGAGNKTEWRYILHLQQQYKNDSRIIWHGKVASDQLPDLIKEYHVLVHPAIYLEVFGLNIVEALSQNKFVIATRCGGAEMQIKEGINGWLVEPNNCDEINQRMQDYIAHPRESTRSEINSIAEHIRDIYKVYQVC